MSTKKERVSDATFKACLFSSDFNFAFKYSWVTAATCKYYCPLVVSPTITNCCKELQLKCDRVPRSAFENVDMHKNYNPNQNICVRVTKIVKQIKFEAACSELEAKYCF